MEARMSQETTAIESGTTLLSRVLEAHATSFTPEAARAILQLTFDPLDIDRMHVLAEKNRQDRLTDVEWQASNVTGGSLLDCKIARKYWRNPPQGVQNDVKTRVRETTLTPLLGLRYGFRHNPPFSVLKGF